MGLISCNPTNNVRNIHHLDVSLLFVYVEAGFLDYDIYVALQYLTLFFSNYAAALTRKSLFRCTKCPCYVILKNISFVIVARQCLSDTCCDFL